MRSFLRVLTFGAAILTSLPAVAATLEVVQGSVSVNRGAGFQPAAGSVRVRDGDVVRASSGSVAHVFYQNGCQVTVSPGAAATVGDAGHCRAGHARGGVPTLAIYGAALGAIAILFAVSK